jgi:Putative transposase
MNGRRGEQQPEFQQCVCLLRSLCYAQVVATIRARGIWKPGPVRPRDGDGRKRDPITIVDGGRPTVVGDLVVQDEGFNLHAKTRAGALDEHARVRLLRYVLRPPLSRERLVRLPDHRVRLQLKQPWRDGDERGEAAWGRCGSKHLSCSPLAHDDLEPVHHSHFVHPFDPRRGVAKSVTIGLNVVRLQLADAVVQVVLVVSRN